MSEYTILYFNSLFIVIFFILGIIIGWIFRENTNTNDSLIEDTLHPEFYDKDGNFINDELMAVHFVENIDDDDDIDNTYIRN